MKPSGSAAGRVQRQRRARLDWGQMRVGPTLLLFQRSPALSNLFYAHWRQDGYTSSWLTTACFFQSFAYKMIFPYGHLIDFSKIKQDEIFYTLAENLNDFFYTRTKQNFYGFKVLQVWSYVSISSHYSHPLRDGSPSRNQTASWAGHTHCSPVALPSWASLASSPQANIYSCSFFLKIYLLRVLFLK